MIDSHVHLDSIFYYRDRNRVIEKCRNQGIIQMINSGTSYKSSLNSIKLSEEYEGIYASVGIHPTVVNELNSDGISKISALAQKNKVVAIGEIGLDYAFNEYNSDLQKDMFRKQIDIARKLDLPIIVHSRNSHEDVIKILKNTPLPRRGGVIHGFLGDINLAKKYLELGLYISIAGNVTYEEEKITLRTIKEINLEKLLIESDSPYLAPLPFKNKRNYPGNIKLVAQAISESLGKSIEEISAITSENARIIFNIK